MQRYKDNYTKEDLNYCYAAILCGWIKKFTGETVGNEDSYQIERLTIELMNDWDEGPKDMVEWLKRFKEVK